MKTTTIIAAIGLALLILSLFSCTITGPQGTATLDGVSAVEFAKLVTQDSHK